MNAAAPHTFAVQADLTKLACDVVPVPTDLFLDVRPQWTDLGQPCKPSGWNNSNVRVTGATCDPSCGQSRLVHWVNIGSVPAFADVEWLVEGVRQALDAAGDTLHGKSILHGRGRPLVGLPLFGTGAGGYDAVRGEVLDAILTECETAAGRHGYDLVVPGRHRSDYAALQARRLGRGADSPALPDGLMAEARRLGDLARTGQLALFLGAGIGQPAGLPSWAELIQRLAEDSPSYASRPGSFSRSRPQTRLAFSRKTSGNSST